MCARARNRRRCASIPQFCKLVKAIPLRCVASTCLAGEVDRLWSCRARQRSFPQGCRSFSPGRDARMARAAGGRTAAASGKSRDVGCEHREDTQHSCQPELRKLRGYQPSVRVFAPCPWARLYPHAAPGRFWSALSHKFSRWWIEREDFRPSYKSGTAPPNCVAIRGPASSAGSR